MFESKPKKKEEFIQTPDVSQEELLKKIGEEKIEEEIYVMPENFRKRMAKKGGPSLKKRHLSLGTIVLIIILILIAGGAIFYWWAKSYTIPSTTPEPGEKISSPEEISQEISQQPEEEQEEIPLEPISLSPALDLETSIKNEKEEVISYLKLSIPQGAYDPSLQPSFEIKELPFEEMYNQGDYQVIVGPYQISPIDIPFNKPLKITAFYQEDIISSRWEEKLLFAYFKDGFWSILPASLDRENNLLTLETDILPATIYGIVCRKSDLVPPELKVGPMIESSLDSDKDGLTDVEERLYKTGINDPDTDKDGITDGQEIINLTDPTRGGEAKLSTSSLIKVYSNLTHQWAIFYPASWFLKAIPETQEREVLIVTDTGEFFSLTVEDNPSLLSPKEWYLTQAPGVNESQLVETTVDSKQGVWSPDGLTLYLSREDKIYIFSYNIGTLEEANFKTTFEMMAKSFQFIEVLSPEDYLFTKDDLLFVGFDVADFQQEMVSLPLNLEQTEERKAGQTNLGDLLNIVVFNGEEASELYQTNVSLYKESLPGAIFFEDEYLDKSLRIMIEPEKERELLMIQRENYFISFEYNISDKNKVDKLVQIAMGKI